MNFTISVSAFLMCAMARIATLTEKRFESSTPLILVGERWNLSICGY